MDVILIILGIMGLGAMLVATYVFLVAARNYVSEDQALFVNKARGTGQRLLVERNKTDRRSGRQVTFPLTVNGLLISSDRRLLSDRRIATV